MKKELITIDATCSPIKAVDKTLVPLSTLISGLFFTFYDDGSYLNHRETRVRTWKIEEGKLFFKCKDSPKNWQIFSKYENDNLVKILSDAMAESVLFGNDI